MSYEDPPPPPEGGYPPPPPPPAPEPPKRGRYRWPWIAGAVVAVVLIAVAVAASSSDDDDTTTAERGTTTTEDETETTEQRTTTTDEPAVTTTAAPPGPTTVPMGTPVEITIDEIEFDQDETYATVTLANPTTDPGPTPGGRCERGRPPEQRGRVRDGEPDFNFVGGDGSVYEVGFAMGFGPTLGYVELSAGQKARGKLIFDIPPDKLAGGKVQLDDTYEDYGEPLAFWTL
jgi:hypothetical protein